MTFPRSPRDFCLEARFRAGPLASHSRVLAATFVHAHHWFRGWGWAAWVLPLLCLLACLFLLHPPFPLLFSFAACYWMLCHKLRKEALFEKCFLWPHCHWETAVREIPFSVGSQFRAELVRGEAALFLSFSSPPPSTFVQGRGLGKEHRSPA